MALPQLERELHRNQKVFASVPSDTRQPVFVGKTITHADFNIFHHLDNAMLLDPYILQPWPALMDWDIEMRKLPELSKYLEERPTLNGIGEDPGLEDRNGVRITQRTPGGRAWLKDGLWCLGESPPS